MNNVSASEWTPPPLCTSPQSFASNLPAMPPTSIKDLSLAQRLQAAEMVNNICNGRQSSSPKMCHHLVWAAQTFWGNTFLDKQETAIRREMHHIMFWCYRHQTQIIHHIAWKQSNCVRNVWKFIEKGGWCPDYTNKYDVRCYNKEEMRLLQREKDEVRKQRRKTRKPTLKILDFMSFDWTMLLLCSVVISCLFNTLCL